MQAPLFNKSELLKDKKNSLYMSYHIWYMHGQYLKQLPVFLLKILDNSFLKD